MGEGRHVLVSSWRMKAKIYCYSLVFFRGRCFFLYKIIINLNEIRKNYLEDAEKRNRGVPFFGPSASAAWVIKWAFRYAMKAFFKETPHQDACEESAHPHLRAAFFQGPVMASGCFF